MAYDWTQIGNEEITNLYLYGDLNTPPDLASDSLIRQLGKNPKAIEINTDTFMTTGPGRFARGCLSSLVETFFSSWFNKKWLTPGQEYTKEGLAKEIVFNGLGGEITDSDGDLSYGIYIHQVELGDAVDDYAQRAYVWNSGAFMLSDDVRFYVDANGTRHIKNYAIVPIQDPIDMDENFDFDGGGWEAAPANHWFEPRIDPWGIGRQVQIEFVGTPPAAKTGTYTYADYLSDVEAHDDELSEGTDLFIAHGLEEGFGYGVVKDLWDSGVKDQWGQSKLKTDAFLPCYDSIH